jgi:NTP pyrophosphatase (non-canonical NTP hydrolase)
MLDPQVRKRWEAAASGREGSFKAAGERFVDLLKLMADLRSPGGCPWDREQSLASLRQYVQEEAAEICEAIDKILAFEDELRQHAGMEPANPAPPTEERARTKSKGLSIAHHPHREDFDAGQSASGAPMPELEDQHAQLRGELYKDLRKELGDLTLQVAFQCDIMQAMGYPGAEESLQLLLEKLIRRHPHVYGERQVADSAEVLANWEDIKQSERRGDS